MADMLRTAAAWPDFRDALSAHLVETSPQLRDMQAQALQNIQAPAPIWHDDIGSLPEGFGLIVAHDLFDALPVRQFIKRRGEWLESCVGYDAEEEAFCFTARAPAIDMAAVMPEVFLAAPDGSVFEVSPASLGIAEALARKIGRDGGACLLVDYGPARTGLGDTLQSVSRHE